MKTTSLFKAIAFVAVIIVSMMGSELKAQENKFITNEEVKNEMVVAKTIFKQDGNQLYRHIRYEYTYDEKNRMSEKKAYKWDSADNQWDPYFKMTYQYEDNKITMLYGRWHEGRKAYDAEIKKSEYELNDENMPVAYKTYKQKSDKSDWTLIMQHRMDSIPNLLAVK